MATVERVDGTSLYFEEYGSGYPILLLAPGGLDSKISMWERATINPLERLSGDFRLIAMDQRNAGRSRGPLPEDPWSTYAEDQLAVADALALNTFHLFGCCIGGSYVLRFAHDFPDRVTAAIAEQPMGLNASNQNGWIERSRGWATELASTRSDLDVGRTIHFVEAMWRQDFVVSLTREEVAKIRVPLTVLPGVDEIHPTEIGREVGRLVDGARTVEPWKDEEHLDWAVDEVRSFLFEHTPGSRSR